MDSYQCKLKKCSCPHGKGTQGLECPFDGGYSCKTCEEDFRKVIVEKFETSLASICQSAKSKACTKDTIPEGYHFDHSDNRCHLNKCKCIFGEPAVFEECPVNGKTKCQKLGCHSFYHYNELSKNCERNVCNCPGGTKMKNCPTHGAHFCEAKSCKKSYYEDNQQCLERNINDIEGSYDYDEQETLKSVQRLGTSSLPSSRGMYIYSRYCKSQNARSLSRFRAFFRNPS